MVSCTLLQAVIAARQEMHRATLLQKVRASEKRTHRVLATSVLVQICRPFGFILKAGNLDVQLHSVREIRPLGQPKSFLELVVGR